MVRPGMSEARFEAILAQHLPDSEKHRRAVYVVPTGLGCAATLPPTRPRKCGLVVGWDLTASDLLARRAGVSLATHGDSLQFAQRLKDRYPVGSPESVVVSDLQVSDFRLDAGVGAPQRTRP